jgi:hypothetical protein
MLNEIERLIKKYGKKHEILIKESITWLDKAEKEWKLEEPMNRDRFIEDLLEHISGEK